MEFFKNVIMVISGLLIQCVYESLKGAESGKCSGGSNMPYFNLNKRQ